MFFSFSLLGVALPGARALDQAINSEGYEGIATVSPDGKYLFFNRDNDIYWVDAALIQTMKKEMLQ